MRPHRIFAGGASCHWNRRETGSLFIATGILVIRVKVADGQMGQAVMWLESHTRRCIQGACLWPELGCAFMARALVLVVVSYVVEGQLRVLRHQIHAKKIEKKKKIL